VSGTTIGTTGSRLHGRDPQIHRLLQMGVFDWTGEDLFCGGQHFPSMALRYSSVLGNSLLRRIERSDATAVVVNFYIKTVGMGLSIMLRQWELNSHKICGFPFGYHGGCSHGFFVPSPG